MANTQLGIYNYKQCIEVHIPSLGAQNICDELHTRLHQVDYAWIIQHQYSHLLTNALHTLVYWRDHSSRKLHSFSISAQRNIWNAYCLAMWDKTALKNAILDNDYIKYHLAEEFEPEDDNDIYIQQEQVCETDHWNEGTSGELTFSRTSPGWH